MANKSSTSPAPGKPFFLLGILTALGAGCCALPALLLLFGVGIGSGAASLLKAFDPYRPFLLAITALVFLWGFAKLYLNVPTTNVCTIQGGGRSPLSRQRTLYWISVLTSLVLLGIPWIKAAVSSISH